MNFKLRHYRKSWVTAAPLRVSGNMERLPHPEDFLRREAAGHGVLVAMCRQSLMGKLRKREKNGRLQRPSAARRREAHLLFCCRNPGR
jgi:hypothetical protein